jgi:hypothetical protein
MVFPPRRRVQIGRQAYLGGLVGRAGAPPLLDGGAPSSAVWDTAESRWIAENTGIEPHIEVEHDPERWGLYFRPLL